MRKRHVLVINWCCMCKRSAKMVDHLVLHCSSARELWSMVFSLFGIQWTMPKGVTELLACWQVGLGQYQCIEIWKAILRHLMWCLWQETNSKRFEGCEWNLLYLKLMFLQTLFEWMVAYSWLSFSTLLDQIDHCTFRIQLWV